MHEFSIVEGILETVKDTAKANNLVSVSSVRIRVGEMRSVAHEMLVFAFEIASKETVAEGAELVVEYVPVRLRCRACNFESGGTESAFVCPNCGHDKRDVAAGKELEILSLEGEDGI